MSIDLLADEHLDQVLRFFLVRRGAAGRWADAEVVATGANNPAACRLWAAPLQYCSSSTKYLLQLERPHSRHWIGNWDNQLHLLLRVRCVGCGLETEETLAASLGQKADNTAAAKATKRQSVAPTPEAKRARSSAGAARPTTTATSASAATTVVEAHVEEEAAVEVTAEVVGELVMETMAQKVQASSCLA